MRSLNKRLLYLLSMLSAAAAQAAGMVPATSVVLINAGDGEASINVTNTDDQAALLYTSLINLPGDEESLLLVNPPVARVEAGEKQTVRFILQSTAPITTQRLKRVSFEGIPQKKPDDVTAIGVTVRQNLPVLITPKDLPIKSDPWTLLSWSSNGKTLTVKNDSRYVVRLSPQINLLPHNINLHFPRAYILPGRTEHLRLATHIGLEAGAKVRIYPVSTYGYQVAPFDAPLSFY